MYDDIYIIDDIKLLNEKLNDDKITKWLNDIEKLDDKLEIIKITNNYSNNYSPYKNIFLNERYSTFICILNYLETNYKDSYLSIVNEIESKDLCNNTYFIKDEIFSYKKQFAECEIYYSNFYNVDIKYIIKSTYIFQCDDVFYMFKPNIEIVSIDEYEYSNSKDETYTTVNGVRTLQKKIKKGFWSNLF
jgi:hypothetical protein